MTLTSLSGGSVTDYAKKRDGQVKNALARIRGRLRELRTRWECLPSGGTLELQFDVS